MGMESFKPIKLDKPKEESGQEQPENQPEKEGAHSIIDKVKEKLELRRKWKEVEKLALDNGLNLKFVSDKEYHERRRPLPRGGALFRMGDTIYVRYEIVSSEEVVDFIKKSLEKNPGQNKKPETSEDGVLS